MTDPNRDPSARTRPPVRVGILSQGTSQFDSRAQRIARSCVAAGDTVTIYSRFRRGLPSEEFLDGYRIVRLPLSRRDARAVTLAARAADRETSKPQPGTQAPSPAGTASGWDIVPRITRVGRAVWRRSRKRMQTLTRTGSEWFEDTTGRVPMVRRFRQFPWRPMQRARWFERQVEPHDIWHGMWAGSLPALSRVRRRHGGRTVYDSRDVFLRARLRANMPSWQRRIMTWFERRWAHAADAVIQVSEPYAAMMERDLGLTDVRIVRNCPDRWDPPEPRPDKFRELLGIPRDTAIVLYQGLLMTHRGIEQAMDAILQVPNAVLILMGFGDQNGSGSSRDAFVRMTEQAPWSGKVLMVDPVPPTALLPWTASSDIMIMVIPGNSENHRYTTPQKLWEAMAAGVPVVASDLPGMAPIVTSTGCGVVCDPSTAGSIAAAIQQLLDEGPAGLRARGERGLAAAHETYNWEAQFEVLDELYARLLTGD